MSGRSVRTGVLRDPAANQQQHQGKLASKQHSRKREFFSHPPQALSQPEGKFRVCGRARDGLRHPSRPVTQYARGRRRQRIPQRVVQLGRRAMRWHVVVLTVCAAQQRLRCWFFAVLMCWQRSAGAMYLGVLAPLLVFCSVMFLRSLCSCLVFVYFMLFLRDRAAANSCVASGRLFPYATSDVHF